MARSGYYRPPQRSELAVFAKLTMRLDKLAMAGNITTGKELFKSIDEVSL